jgi:hypothetical protein
MKKLIVAVAIVFTANAAQAQSSGPKSMYFGGAADHAPEAVNPPTDSLDAIWSVSVIPRNSASVEKASTRAATGATGVVA